MAIPLQSLSGTEVLRRGGIDAQSNTWTSLKFDGGITTAGTGNQAHVVPANHIITVTNVIFCEQGNSTKLIYLWIDDSANTIYQLNAVSLAAYETYVWNESITLVGGDSMRVDVNLGANIDIYYSYIDQSWV